MYIMISTMRNRKNSPRLTIIDRGVNASCIPLTILPLTNNGSLPRYINRTKNISNALIGKDFVVDNGFNPHGGMVAITKNIMGSKHIITSMADPQGPLDEYCMAHPHDVQLDNPVQV